MFLVFLAVVQHKPGEISTPITFTAIAMGVITSRNSHAIALCAIISRWSFVVRIFQENNMLVNLSTSCRIQE